MKNLLSIIKLGLVGAFLAISFNGCGSSDSGINSVLGGGNSLGTDNLKITQLGNNFNVVWDKKSGSYSEVVYTSKVVADERGEWFLTDNLTGKHTLNCTLSDNSDSSVSYSCIGSGPSILGGEHELKAELRFTKGEEYKILMNYGFDFTHGEVDYILEFNDNTLTIQ